ncbi:MULTISPECIES: NAD-dependent epimerase/dehydratase family protein [Empedobacter]|uniref:NAD-dependent epimerase/dehydratase family protein n=1 Tax=Empedobacter falsenii TaxID=343874 RepID=A0A427BQU3_9FLAO|nr:MULTISPECIES: NAD-dependent epimerase/dehydratase family protein [Empedobacter]MDH0659194.1 NAD-dependent epimerase/dehydratase family protein [Empedobacter sp. GD03865]MDH0674277.1 NAD-dependent epimerase/dehydratase family protein [Empedobacter sp. GD03861]RRT92850.1 NAD-dependent epimerase/dehydratase family protein [Empedobacter falsenii]RRT93075.1 NAD-dependent epimerase/dehydratase family protein [Empedobacter falsenii]
MNKTALVLGSSGLIGSLLLEKLFNHPDYSTIITIVRKPQQINHPKLIEIVTDFNSEINLDDIETIDSIFSCLGTTRKKTPDLDAYHKIEVDIPNQFAKLGIQKGLTKFHYISAIGANTNSSNFYLKMKGEAERTLQKNNIKQLFLYRPSLLIGNRAEYRLAENISAKIFPLINFFLRGNLSKYKSIEAEKVAQSLLENDLQLNSEKVSVLYYNEIINSINTTQ